MFEATIGLRNDVVRAEIRANPLSGEHPDVHPGMPRGNAGITSSSSRKQEILESTKEALPIP